MAALDTISVMRSDISSQMNDLAELVCSFFWH
jgi:hypothetical protein